MAQLAPIKSEFWKCLNCQWVSWKSMDECPQCEKTSTAQLTVPQVLDVLREGYKGVTP